MYRRIDYQITEPAPGLLVKQYLKAKGYTGQSMIQLKKRPDFVLVNGSPAHMTCRLRDGDSLTVHSAIVEAIFQRRPPPKKYCLYSFPWRFFTRIRI